MGCAHAPSETVFLPSAVLLLVLGCQSLECPSVCFRPCWGPPLRLPH